MVGRSRNPFLKEQESTSAKYWPCDVHAKDETTRLIGGKYAVPHILDDGVGEQSFKEALQSRAPLLAKILGELPTDTEEIHSMVELMEQGNLVAGCNGGDYQNG